MVSYDPATKTYTVTFQERQPDGTFKPHAVTVDAFLPTRPGITRLAYARDDQDFDPKNQALWPAIIEKAYAKWKEGYDMVGRGGRPEIVMEEITGVQSVKAAIPAVKDVIPTFEKWQKDQKAVVCSTVDFVKQERKQGLFKGTGTGPYSATLTDQDGAAAELVKGSVEVSDQQGKAGTARDDSRGAMRGDGLKQGRVTYETGSVSLKYLEKAAPKDARDLVATYQYKGLISSALNLYGDHAYIFREVRDGLLYFHNPWGAAAHNHPKGVSPAEFVRLFERIAVNSLLPERRR